MYFIIITFIVGVVLGRFIDTPIFQSIDTGIVPLLIILLFFVGLSSGGDPQLIKTGFSRKAFHYFLPFFSLIGSILGGLLVAWMLGIDMRSSILVSMGMGYYSVPSVMVTASAGAYVGSLLFVTNVLREILTILLAPFLARYIGGYALIAAGGATTMDVSLPVVARYSGSKYILPSFINGLILTLTIPVFISLVNYV